MKKLIFFLIGFVILSSSCQKFVFCKHGEGKVIEQQRDLKDFSQIDLATTGNLFLTQADTFSVVISAEENLQDLIITEVKGSKLIIKTKKCIKPNDSVNIYVSAPNLNDVNLTGSGNIKTDGNWNFESGMNISISGFGNIDFDNFTCSGNTIAKITGAGNINLDNFSCTSFNAEITGSGDIFATEVRNFTELENKIIGSGNIFVSGSDTVENNSISISGTGKVREYDITSKNVDISVSGTGNVFVTATDDLNINISGIADIYYKGEPSITTNISGSGNIHNENK